MINPIQAPEELMVDAVGFSFLNEKYKINPTKGKNKPSKNQPMPLLVSVEFELEDDELEE
jgi:hypothetical protein